MYMFCSPLSVLRAGNSWADLFAHGSVISCTSIPLLRIADHSSQLPWRNRHRSMAICYSDNSKYPFAFSDTRCSFSIARKTQLLSSHTTRNNIYHREVELLQEGGVRHISCPAGAAAKFGVCVSFRCEICSLRFSTHYIKFKLLKELSVLLCISVGWYSSGLVVDGLTVNRVSDV